MRVIVTGGGTGGHIYPALAIADEIKKREPDSDILYIGNDIGLEKDIVPKTGYPIEYVAARWFDKSNVFELAATGFVTFRGVRQTLKIMKKFKPDAVIGTGGFVCFPVIYAGHKYGANVIFTNKMPIPEWPTEGLRDLWTEYSWVLTRPPNFSKSRKNINMWEIRLERYFSMLI